ncbi:MAG: UbiD family decarboxylase [Gammaproteobacteria bacterium]|nr:UbiD family decarboxylase [Gammaproteobacteria bacterium]
MHAYVDSLIARGDVRIVAREVDPRHELAAVVQRSQAESEAPLLFRKVRGTALPVVSNLYGSQRRLCELVGAPDRRFCPRFVDLTESVAGAAMFEPVAEAADLAAGRLGELPAVHYFERDGGPYITAGVFLARDPETGVANLSFCRSMQVSDTELRVRLAPPHDLYKYQAKAEATGAALEVAILLGPPPEVFLAACASIPYAADELELAARIRGAALPMRRCRTIDLDVPAETEIVIEGRILPSVRRPEGPFGEFMGYYVDRSDNNVFEVSAVVWRPGAYYHALVCGSPEDLRALEVAFAARTYQALVAELPGILDVSCYPAPQHTIIQIAPQYDGHAQRVLLKAFGSSTYYNKICIVVDEDVDIHDFNDVWWAVVSRCRVDRKVTIVPEVPGFYRDEAGVHRGRLGVDATKPWGQTAAFERKRIPGAAGIDLADYIGGTRG